MLQDSGFGAANGKWTPGFLAVITEAFSNLIMGTYDECILLKELLDNLYKCIDRKVEPADRCKIKKNL